MLGKALYDTLVRNRIYFSEAEDTWFNITIAAWAHGIIIFILSVIHNIPGRQEKLPHLKPSKKIPPYYVLCGVDATTKSLLHECGLGATTKSRLRDQHTSIEGIFGNKETFPTVPDNSRRKQGNKPSW